MDKAIENRLNLTQLRSLFTSGGEELESVFVTMRTNDISQSIETLGILRVVEPPLQPGQGQKDNSIPFLYGFIRLDAKVAQAQVLLEIEVIDFNGPPSLISRQSFLSRQVKVGGQKVLGVFIPTVPFTNEDTDFKREFSELTAELANQVKALLLVCSGQLDASVPLVLEVSVPLRQLLIVQQAIGLDGANHVPVLTPTEFQL